MRKEENKWSGMQKMKNGHRPLGFWGYFVMVLAPL
jgi:hypothetical protein